MAQIESLKRFKSRFKSQSRFGFADHWEIQACQPHDGDTAVFCCCHWRRSLLICDKNVRSDRRTTFNSGTRRGIHFRSIFHSQHNFQFLTTIKNVRWYLLKQAVLEAATICPRLARDLDLWPFDLESGVRVTCDVGYLSANFSLPRLLCSRLRPDVRDRQTSNVRQTSDRQTDRRQTASLLNSPAY